MERRNKLWTSVLAAIGMGFLIIDAKIALQGAAEGIELCIRTVVPSLFPFFVLSIFLTSSMAGQRILWLLPLVRLCGIPEGAESLLLVGLVGGYPVGAQSVAQAYHMGQLRKEDAERMLGFCNNAGPAFLFGMAASLFQTSATAWLLWIIHILAALMVAVLLPGSSGASTALPPSKRITLPQAMERAVRIIANVCGWVVLFRILIAFLQRWCLWLLPQTAQIGCIGILELTNSFCELSHLNGEGLRFLLSACFLGFGGLCVAMQTMSVTTGLNSKTYFLGKAMQTIISFLLAAVIQRFLFPAADQAVIPAAVWACFLCSGLILLLIMKKSSRNPVKASV